MEETNKKNLNNIGKEIVSFKSNILEKMEKINKRQEDTLEVFKHIISDNGNSNHPNFDALKFENDIEIKRNRLIEHVNQPQTIINSPPQNRKLFNIRSITTSKDNYINFQTISNQEEQVNNNPSTLKNNPIININNKIIVNKRNKIKEHLNKALRKKNLKM